jgi:hypothetical protein
MRWQQVRVPTSLAILAGDLYSAPGGDVRGATGDLRSVWSAFADAFAWVVGVAGNHDLFGSERELVICGHAHWDSPLHEQRNGSQVLNVDARAVLLVP